MGMQKSSPELMPARGMFRGGLAALGRFLGVGANPRVNPATMGSADDILINPMGIASRRGAGSSTIPPNQQLIPYQPPVKATAPSAGSTSPNLFKRGLGALGKGGKFLLGASPFGAGLYSFFGGEGLGDGTMVGEIMRDYGLTEEEVLLLEEELARRGKTLYMDKEELQPFADSIIATRSGGPGLKTEQEMANEQIKEAQEKAKNIFEERDKRRMQAGILGAGLETIIRGQRGEPVLGAIAEGLKSQALPAFKEKGEMQLAAQIKRNLQDAKIVAEAQGKVGDLVKLRASIAKQAGETVDPDAKASIVQTLAALDQFLFQRFGISSGAGTGSQNFLQQLLGEQSARQATVKDATR
jgi:hypothetical protein